MATTAAPASAREGASVVDLLDGLEACEAATAASGMNADALRKLGWKPVRQGQDADGRTKEVAYARRGNPIEMITVATDGVNPICAVSMPDAEERNFTEVEAAIRSVHGFSTEGVRSATRHVWALPAQVIVLEKKGSAAAAKITAAVMLPPK